MRILADQLREFVAQIFHRAGCRPPEDRCIAERLVESNLAGHDSHGVIRVSDYVAYLERGQVRANQQVRVIVETDVLLVLDGNLGFGQSIGQQAMEMGIAKAGKQGLAAVALRNCGHLGRIGDWPETIAAAGLASLHFVNTSGFGLLVAPFGGIERRLSANPIAAGFPRRDADPIILDISTSSIAEGKLKVARNRGKQVPPGCIIDADGQPTTDPQRFYAQRPGVILPFGGHKGYGLALITELMAGALTGGGCTNPANNKFLSNGMFSILLNPDAFGPRDEFDREVERFLAYVKSSRLAAGFDEILLPGEPEQRHRRRLLAEGIEIEAATWQALTETARRLGLIEIPSDAGAARR